MADEDNDGYFPQANVTLNQICKTRAALSETQFPPEPITQEQQVKLIRSPDAEEAFSHRQGGVRIFDAGVKVLTRGHQS